jgi:hypothetical protein
MYIYGKWNWRKMATSVVCCKQKMETANFRLFAANENGKRKFFFYWSANDKQ